MNSKLLVIGLILSSLLVISASGQKLLTTQQVILQDDKSQGNHACKMDANGQL